MKLEAVIFSNSDELMTFFSPIQMSFVCQLPHCDLNLIGSLQAMQVPQHKSAYKKHMLFAPLIL